MRSPRNPFLTRNKQTKKTIKGLKEELKKDFKDIFNLRFFFFYKTFYLWALINGFPG